MNDITFVEAARVLAQNAMNSSTNSTDRIGTIFQAVLSRMPNDDDSDILHQGFAHQLMRFQKDPDAASRLVAVGEYPIPASVNQVELAAYTTIASLILNLDEAVTKQ